MLPLPPVILNGHHLSHEELSIIHVNMRIAIRAATLKYCLDGPRLLYPDRGERYVLSAHGRDREGNLLASITVHLPWANARYVRKVRLIRALNPIPHTKVEVARG
jgi:hypothetical protein